MSIGEKNRRDVRIIFRLHDEHEIIPIEVKADTNITGKSLTLFRKEFKPKQAIRFSLKNLKVDEELINIPLFMADRTVDLLAFANKRE